MISNTRSTPGPVQGCAQEPPEQPSYCMNPLVQCAPPAQARNSRQGNAESQEPTGYPDTAPFSQANEKTGARFSPRKRLNDPIFLVLFIVSVVGFAVVSGLAINTFIQLNGLGGGFGSSSSGQTGNDVTLDYHTLYLLVVCCALGLAVAALWLGLIRALTKVVVEVTLALTVLLNIGICVYFFIIRYWSGAVIFLVIAVLSVLFYWTLRKRVPLAKLLIQTTIDITRHHPVVYLIALVGLVFQRAWSIWYAFTCIAIYVKWTPGRTGCSASPCSSAKVGGLIFYSTFSYCWTSQVIANVIVCTLSGGIFGGWYYCGPRAANSGLPKRASLKSFVRSTTLSLGSIAFGSLIVTIVELLRVFLQGVQQYKAGQVDPLYGKAYLPAAKDTWRLMRDRGINALINDSLVGIVIMWSAYVNGFICALFAFFYLRYTHPAYNGDGEYTSSVLLFAFLIGINEGLTLGSVIDAGVSTIFVGMAEDPIYEWVPVGTGPTSSGLPSEDIDITFVSLASQSSQTTTVPLAATEDNSPAKRIDKHFGTVSREKRHRHPLQTDLSSLRAVAEWYDGDQD
ncbi:Protein pns1 [Saitozyma podzolica]|uniref:Protein PNS1 n=1 Tax=Saitozyma podzolica TaxID=1890683 RepID=A0A427YT52_9TREE|nr:Protein pns1 [Saitozyma podzolica]